VLKFALTGLSMRIFVFLMLFAIVASLASGLVLLFKDRGQGSRGTAKALTIRVALSFALFIFLMAGYYFGLITGKV